jgi:hypothetical protein
VIDITGRSSASVADDVTARWEAVTEPE